MFATEVFISRVPSTVYHMRAGSIRRRKRTISSRSLAQCVADQLLLRTRADSADHQRVGGREAAKQLHNLLLSDTVNRLFEPLNGDQASLEPPGARKCAHA